MGGRLSVPLSERNELILYLRCSSLGSYMLTRIETLGNFLGRSMNPVSWTRRIFGICLFVMVWNPLLCFATDTEEDPRLPLAMEVFLKKPKAHWYEIHIHLTNISSEPLMVDVHDLPWSPPNDSKWFHVARNDSQHLPIEQQSFLGELGSQTIRLVPGESVQDKLVLNHRVPSLLDDISQFGVQLQWECPPEALKFVCKEDTLQNITIPKGDLGKPDVFAIDEARCRKLERTIGLIDIPKDHEVLFLLSSESVLNDLAQAQSLLFQVDDYVRLCQPWWTNSWGVSFFTEKKFAGFLRDEEGRQLFERGMWQQANIGQYSSQIRTLYRFPWIKKRANTVYLSVYH